MDIPIIENTKEKIIENFKIMLDKFNKSDLNNKELEIRFNYFSLDVLRLMNINGDKNLKKEELIEINHIDGKKKYRLRSKLENLDEKINLKKILDKIKKKGQDIIIEKYEIDKIGDKNFDIVLSVENKIPYNDIYKGSLYIVENLNLAFQYFIVEAKIKTRLSPKLYINSSDAFFSKDNKKLYSIEIEYKNTGEEKEVLKNLEQILCLIFGKTKSDLISLCSKFPFFKFPTFSKLIENILDINPHETYMTRKVDGDYVQFLIKSNNCMIFKPPLVHQFKYNNKKNITCFGHAEYTNIGRRRIYPFYLEILYYGDKKIEFENRMDNMKKIIELFDNQENNYPKSISLPISSKIKHEIMVTAKAVQGPFDNIVDFVQELQKQFIFDKNDGFDGVILMNNKAEDIKLKFDSTVDLLIALRKTGTRNDGVLIFDSFVHNKEFEKVLTLTTDEYIFDRNFKMINYKNYLLPLIFIGEISLLEEKIIKIRIDKTDLLINNNYYGNPIKTLKLSQKSNNSTIKYNQFINMKPSELLSIFKKKEEITEKINDEKLICTPLNKNINWYDNTSRERPQFNNLINYIKSCAIYMCLNIMVNPTINKPAILCINCGRGGDRFKFYFNNVGILVGTDISSSILDMFRKNIDVMSKEKSDMFKTFLILIRLEDKDFKDKMVTFLNKNKIKFPFEYIDVQLGIHFSYNEHTKDHIAKNLSYLLKKYGKIVITTNNGDYIKENIMIDEEKIFKIEDHQFHIKRLDENKIAIKYTYSHSDYLIEYMISKNDMIDTFKKYDLINIFSSTFIDIMPSQDTFTQLYPFLGKSRESNSGQEFVRKLGKIHQSEDIKKILKFYQILIFEKK